MNKIRLITVLSGEVKGTNVYCCYRNAVDVRNAFPELNIAEAEEVIKCMSRDDDDVVRAVHALIAKHARAKIREKELAELMKDYIAANDVHCVCCGDKTVVYSDDENNQGIYRAHECNKCKATWGKFFTLKEVDYQDNKYTKEGQV